MDSKPTGTPFIAAPGLTDDAFDTSIPIANPTRPRSADRAAESLEALSELESLIERELVSHPDADFPEFAILPEQLAREVDSLQERQLSQYLATWVDRYECVGERHPYLWTWCRQGVELTTLSSVAAELRASVGDTKVLGVMFDVLLDDVADRGGDLEFLEQLIDLPFAGFEFEWRQFPTSQRAYGVYSELVWREVQSRVEGLPRYAEFAELLRYDYLQLMNAMRYSHLLNRFPSMLNLAEHDLYLPHNMHMMISSTIDIMASPDFEVAEIGRLREAIWHAQYMGRIGNLVTTWERELHEHDYTSGVFARAVVYGDLSLDELRDGDRDSIREAIISGKHEEHFMQKWQDHRQQLLILRDTVQSIDLGTLVEGLERLICLHLASRGQK